MPLINCLSVQPASSRGKRNLCLSAGNSGAWQGRPSSWERGGRGRCGKGAPARSVLIRGFSPRRSWIPLPLGDCCELQLGTGQPPACGTCCRGAEPCRAAASLRGGSSILEGLQDLCLRPGESKGPGGGCWRLCWLTLCRCSLPHLSWRCRGETMQGTGAGKARR